MTPQGSEKTNGESGVNRYGHDTGTTGSPFGDRGRPAEGTEPTGGPSGSSPVGSNQSGQGGRRLGFEDRLPIEFRTALTEFERAAAVCEWCADRCLDEGPEMARCVRLCHDVADLATVNATFVARDSAFGPDLAVVFASAAEECADECKRHPHDHCRECAAVLARAVDSTDKFLDSLRAGPIGGSAPRTGVR